MAVVNYINGASKKVKHVGCLYVLIKTLRQVLLVTGGSNGYVDSTEILAENQASWKFGPNFLRKLTFSWNANVSLNVDLL